MTSKVETANALFAEIAVTTKLMAERAAALADGVIALQDFMKRAAETQKSCMDSMSGIITAVRKSGHVTEAQVYALQDLLTALKDDLKEYDRLTTFKLRVV